jgi:hypothetical protein
VQLKLSTVAAGLKLHAAASVHPGIPVYTQEPSSQIEFILKFKASGSVQPSGAITIVKVVLNAQIVPVGVNVYVVVLVLLMAEFHVPVMPLEEVVGNAGIAAPLQYGPTVGNVGVTFGVIVSVSVTVVAH